MAEPPPPRSAFPALDTIGKLIPVVAVVLPVAGVIFRIVSFGAASSAVPPSVAAALPIAGLAVAGFGALLPTLGTLLVSLPIAWLAVRSRFFQPGAPDGRLVGLLLLFSIVGVIVFTIPSIRTFSQAVVTVTSGAFTIALGVVLQRTGGRPRLFALGAVFALIALVNVAIAGLVPNTAATTVGQIEFVAGARTPDGTYSVLGQDDRTTWLLRCTVGSSPIQIPSDSIALLTVSDFGPRPSEDAVGFVQRCP